MLKDNFYDIIRKNLLGDIIMKEDLNELITKAKLGSSDAKEKIIEKTIPLIKNWISIYSTYSISNDDLMESGILGVLKAIDYFDFSKNILFTSYVSYWIKKEMLDFINNNSRNIQIPIRFYLKLRKLRDIEQYIIYEKNYFPTDEELLEEYNKQNPNHILTLKQIKAIRQHFLKEASLNEIIDEDIYTPDKYFLKERLQLIMDSNSNFEDEIIKKIWFEKIHLILKGVIPSNLTKREKEVLWYRFGFDPNIEPLSLREIGNLLNITRQGTYNSLKNALNKLKQILLVNKIITREEYLEYQKENDEKEQSL